jgi:hypothetical protein
MWQGAVTECDVNENFQINLTFIVSFPLEISFLQHPFSPENKMFIDLKKAICFSEEGNVGFFMIMHKDFEYILKIFFNLKEKTLMVVNSFEEISSSRFENDQELKNFVTFAKTCLDIEKLTELNRISQKCEEDGSPFRHPDETVTTANIFRQFDRRYSVCGLFNKLN